MAGLAGLLYAAWAEIVTPGLFSLGQSAEIIVWVIVGGLGTLAGPIAGAVLLGCAKTLLGSQALVNNQVVFGSILLGAVLLPQGAVPAVQRGMALWMQALRRSRPGAAASNAREPEHGTSH